MAVFKRSTRFGFRPSWLWMSVWAVIAAVLVVATAPLWHRHERQQEEHKGCCTASCGDHHTDEKPVKPHDEDDCSICLTVSVPMGDGLPPLPLLDLPVLGNPERWIGAERVAVMWVGMDRASRGPPVL